MLADINAERACLTAKLRDLRETMAARETAFGAELRDARTRIAQRDDMIDDLNGRLEDTGSWLFHACDAGTADDEGVPMALEHLDGLLVTRH